MKLINRFLPKHKESFFLFGPRGTGKSTWLKKNFPYSIYIDLLSPEDYRILSAKPERLRELVEGNPEKKTVILDEIQKVPQLLAVVHQLIEEKKSLQFILTGSSSRKLKRSGVDLLAGRALLKTCHPFLASELGSLFCLETSLQYGMLPLVINSKNPEDVLKAYITLYIREEVQMESLVRNIGNFSRFLEAISFSHASILNTSTIARECSVGRKTVEGYITVLEDILLSFRLPVFTKKAKRLMVSHPKFYYFDTGVFRTVRPVGPLDKPEEISGAAMEGLVAQQLHAWNSYSGGKNNLYYWRTKSGNEVDFIVYGKTEFAALEVKNSDKVNIKDLKGLQSFKEDYPESETILLYRGKEKIKTDKVLCIPCGEFLKRLLPGQKLLHKI